MVFYEVSYVNTKVKQKFSEWVVNSWNKSIDIDGYIDGIYINLADAVKVNLINKQRVPPMIKLYI